MSLSAVDLRYSKKDPKYAFFSLIFQSHSSILMSLEASLIFPSHSYFEPMMWLCMHKVTFPDVLSLFSICITLLTDSIYIKFGYLLFKLHAFFFFFLPSDWPPHQWPEPLQWKCWILNPLSHQGTPQSACFLSWSIQVPFRVGIWKVWVTIVDS